MAAGRDGGFSFHGSYLADEPNGESWVAGITVRLGESSELAASQSRAIPGGSPGRFLSIDLSCRTELAREVHHLRRGS